ncbi:universal stress protein [Actinomadura macra]|uniref:universal stress protein n=1 Tax=Actinomadura macra TaxID=46164 RepID=UPI00082A4DD7|nr:universal stress protein [Actinomadura macra]
MTACLLLVVDDSPPALVAARYTIELARTLHARVRVVNVAADAVLTSPGAGALDLPGSAGRPDSADHSVLGHVERLAHLEEVEVQAVQLTGDIAQSVLDEARRVRPDLIVLGRAEDPGSGLRAALSPWAARVLESAEQPVLMVPQEWRPRGSRP